MQNKYAWHEIDGRHIFRPVSAIDIQRSSFPCPMLSLDTMDPVQSMLDGKMYDSKSALRGTYKTAGVIEVGKDPARLKPRQRASSGRKDIKEAVEKASARFARGERIP